jgi:hypothetical protein
VRDEHAQIDVPPLADGAEPSAQRAGIFHGREPEESLQIADPKKSPNVSDQGEQCGGGDEAHRHHRLQAREVRDVAGERRELPFDCARVHLKHINLITCGANVVWKSGRAVAGGRITVGRIRAVAAVHPA